MPRSIVKASYRSVDFANDKKLNSVVFYGCVRNPIRAHSYFIVDLWNSKCHIIELSNLYTLQNLFRCLRVVHRNNYREYKIFPLLRTLFQEGTYHLQQYGLLVGSNLPHHCVHIGNKRFWIGNAGTHNALICDLETSQVSSFTPASENDILGPQVSYDKASQEVFFITYDARGHLHKALVDPAFRNRFSIKAYNTQNGRIRTLWEDQIDCLLLDGFRVTSDRRFAIFSDLRFALDQDNQFDPNSIYIVDLDSNIIWEIPNLKASAHIELDPDDPHVFYASEHQIGIIVRDKVTDADISRNADLDFIARLKFVTKEIGGFVGAASILKYKITPEGPKLSGLFNAGRDFVRATWHFAFKNRGKKYIGTISSPYILIIDADTMQLYKKIDTGITPLYGLQVSEDGEQFYCNSFFDFYIVGFDSGKVEAQIKFQQREKGRVFHVSAHTTRVSDFY